MSGRGDGQARAVGNGRRERGASHDVALQIRQYVHREGLRPGDRIGRLEDLERQFGVSRPTLREALRLLSGAHLVRSTTGPGGGVFVAATVDAGMARNVTEAIAAMVDADSIGLVELMETRVLLEVPVAGLAAAHASDADMQELRRLIDALAASTRMHEQFVRCDVELHRAIGRIAANKLAIAFTGWVEEVLVPRVRDLVAPHVDVDRIVAQHTALVDAIARGDAAGAEQAKREHLEYMRGLVAAAAG